MKVPQKALGKCKHFGVAEQSCQAMGHIVMAMAREKGVWGGLKDNTASASVPKKRIIAQLLQN